MHRRGRSIQIVGTPQIQSALLEPEFPAFRVAYPRIAQLLVFFQLTAREDCFVHYDRAGFIEAQDFEISAGFIYYFTGAK